MLVATAHGVDLRTMLKNPDLSPLVGGVGPVLLGDEAAKMIQKTSVSYI